MVSVVKVLVALGVGFFAGAFHAFLVLLECAQAHAHGGESAVVIEVLHGDLAGQVGEEGDAIGGAFVAGGIPEGGHSFGEVEEFVEAFDAAARGGDGRRLGNGIDAHLTFHAVDVAETPGD